MGELAEAFEEHLRSLTDDEWNALATRVRTPQGEPQPGQGGRAEADRRRRAAQR